MQTTSTWKPILSTRNPQPIRATAFKNEQALKANAKNMSSSMNVSPYV